MGIGDWGLGIAQSPIPNPQSPIIQQYNITILLNNNIYLKFKAINNLQTKILIFNYNNIILIKWTLILLIV